MIRFLSSLSNEHFFSLPECVGNFYYLKLFHIVTLTATRLKKRKKTSLSCPCFLLQACPAHVFYFVRTGMTSVLVGREKRAHCKKNPLKKHTFSEERIIEKKPPITFIQTSMNVYLTFSPLGRITLKFR